MTSQSAYFEYLKGRSLSGKVYRRYWLYPRLDKYLNGKVLDVGCGIGDFLAFRPATVGVDINPHTVDWCCNCGFDAKLMAPDLLPFRDSEFNSVLLDNVLEHLIEPQRLLSEIRRVIVSDGVLIVGVPGQRGFLMDSDHKYFYDEQALVAVMKNAGFSCQTLLHMPIRSKWLNTFLRQYCIYGVFRSGL